LNKIDFNTVVDKLVKGQTEACSIWFQFVYSAPGPILDVFKSTNIPVPNFFHYKNPSVDAGIRKILSEENRQEANRLAREVEKQTVDDAPCACLYQLNDLMIFRKTISNLAFTGLGVPLLYDTRLETE
jgi:ABC-type oligopeptide transport system substrate-binding subunit